MEKNLILFDVDGTITESGEKMNFEDISYLNNLKKDNIELGIVGGGKLDKILLQTQGVIFDHYFSECGCVYSKYFNNEITNIYSKNIRNHELYSKFNILIKCSLDFLSKVDYEITGNFIDLRTGIIYISIIGLCATKDERCYFMNNINIDFYREKLLNILINKSIELKIYDKINIVYGGTFGIAIYPVEYDKIQILDAIEINKYKNIYYFGDKYEKNGNDYLLLNSNKLKGFKIDKVEQTFNILKTLIL